MQTKVTFYFLHLLEGADSYREKFDEMSETICSKTNNLTDLFQDFEDKSSSDFDPEEWLKLKGNINNYLFCWDEIKENNSEILNFLKTNYGIDWVKKAKITKTDYDKIIISFETNYVSLILNNDKVKLKINDGRTDEFIAKTEEGKLNLYDNNNAEVKYYKERIILRIETQCEGHDLNKLFKQIKIKRARFLKNKHVNCLEIQKRLCELCNKGSTKCIESLYQYPLIEIEDEHRKLPGFNFEDEAITTFFYEIPDVGNMRRHATFFPVKYEKVLMRVSGPSIITTKMSSVMRAKLINLIYESGLYKMREDERKNKYSSPCKQIYGENYEYLRNYIATTFFTIESGISGIEMTSSLQMLSYISMLGVSAGISALTYAVFKISPFPLEVLKTYFAMILSVMMIYIIINLIGIDYIKQKYHINPNFINRIKIK